MRIEDIEIIDFTPEAKKMLAEVIKNKDFLKTFEKAFNAQKRGIVYYLEHFKQALKSILARVKYGKGKEMNKKIYKLQIPAFTSEGKLVIQEYKTSQDQRHNG